MSCMRTFLFIALFMLFNTPSIAEAKVFKIAVYKVPMMVTGTDSGVFVELFKEAAKRAGIDFQIEMYPAKRTVAYFYQGKIDGYFPAFDESAGSRAVKTEPIHVKNNVVFVRNDAETINEVFQLAGKVVGLTLGYHYDDRILSYPDIKITYATSDVVNMQKLSAGEIDAFVAEDITGLVALEESGVTNIHYDPDSFLYEKRVFIALQDDKEGQVAAAKLSEALIEMKKDGTYNRIFGK